MTPMIDCVFQLLLFFLVASHFEEQGQAANQGELKARLPDAAAAMPLVTKPKELIVGIDQKGAFSVAGQVLTEEQLTDRLRQAKRDNPGRESILIRGDERADWKYVARVFSICFQLDIKDRRFAVIPPEEQDEQ